MEYGLYSEGCGRLGLIFLFALSAGVVGEAEWFYGYFTFVCGVLPKCIFGESPNNTYSFTYIVTLVPPDFSFFLFSFL